MKTVVTLIAFFSWTVSINAQTETQPMADIDKAVKEIKSSRNTYQKIEKINTSDGMRLVFLKDKELKLIVVKALEPNTEKDVEWYYVKGQLVYTETNWVDVKTKATVFHEKCYLNNGHLIAWVNSKNEHVDNFSAEFKKMDTDLVAYGEKIKADTTTNH